MKYIDKLQQKDIVINGAKTLTEYEASRLKKDQVAEYVRLDRLKYLFTHAFELVTDIRNHHSLNRGEGSASRNIRKGLDKAVAVWLEVFDLLVVRDPDTVVNEKVFTGERIIRYKGRSFVDQRSVKKMSDEAYAKERLRIEEYNDKMFSDLRKSISKLEEDI